VIGPFKELERASMSIVNVAKAAGVSSATVSRVLNNFPGVRPETVRRVREAVRDLNFSPLRRRRNAGGAVKTGGRRPGRTGNIAVITLGQTRDWLQMPVMASVVGGIRSAVSERGFRLILDEVLDPDKPNRLIDKREIDGAVVFVTGAMPPETCRETLDKLSQLVPVVWTMGEGVGGRNVDHVTCDNVGIGHVAFEYLVKMNCKEVGFVSLNPAWPFMRLRAQSFFNIACDSHLPATAYLINNCDPMIIHSYGKQVVTAATAEELVARIAAAKPRPTGLFIANDLTTATLTPILVRQGLQPGQAMTIVSCDNEESRLAALQPQPASIDIGAEEVGYRAVVRLVARMRHPDERPIVIRVAAKLEPPNAVPAPR
jgi:DNA-binding LacI/PurR family transcriptional regulator